MSRFEPVQRQYFDSLIIVYHVQHQLQFWVLSGVSMDPVMPIFGFEYYTCFIFKFE